MARRNKPWYIWFSIFALALLMGDTSRRIKVLRENIGLWNRACKNFFKLCILYIILPIFLLSGLTSLFLRMVGEDPFAQDIIMSIVFLVIYLLGVYAAYKHVVWRDKNIPHLLEPKKR